ncbi:hypothetical protein ACI78R_07215 [Geodermatophilus sp. SYSU D01106]
MVWAVLSGRSIVVTVIDIDDACDIVRGSGAIASAIGDSHGVEQDSLVVRRNRERGGAGGAGGVQVAVSECCGNDLMGDVANRRGESEVQAAEPLLAGGPLREGRSGHHSERGQQVGLAVADTGTGAQLAEGIGVDEDVGQRVGAVVSGAEVLRTGSGSVPSQARARR